MKFGNTNPILSTVGRNGKGFRAVRKRSDSDSGSSERNRVRSNVDSSTLSTDRKSTTNPSFPVLGISVFDINWREVRTDDRFFFLLASYALGESFKPAEMDVREVLHHGLSVFNLICLKYITSEVSKGCPNAPVYDYADSRDHSELVPIAVNYLMFAAFLRGEGANSTSEYRVNCDEYV